ncbi:MFS transporter [Paenibacillus hamazuiensis]|uniref:MFS transporter n=1 Tax=Paenibacillus hamazuiensis TaxID=2936508 RepID=UPI00200F9232|nr:MFS transporter [Paenibacillus hamazuiensis]
MKRALASKRNYAVLLVLFLAWIVGYFDKVSINVAIIPITKELNLTPDKAGLILSSFFLSYAVMQLVGGYLADKFGSKKVLTGAIFTWSIFTGITGWANSFFGMIASRFMVGAGEGSFPTASSVTIANTFPKEQRARAKSVVQSGSSVGIAIGSIVIASLTASFGWRIMFYSLAVLGVLLAILVWFVLGASDQKQEGENERRANKVPVNMLLKTPLVWKLLVVYFFANFVFWGLQSWLPSYWVKVKGMSMVSMGAYSSIPAILGFISFLVSGWVLDKYMLGKEKYIIIGGAFLSAIFIYLMFNATSIPLAFTYLTLSNVFLNPISITVFIMPLKHMAKESVGTATGIINAGAQVGSILSPTVMGYLISSSGNNYNAAFMFLVFSCIVMLIAGLTINTKKSANEMGPDSPAIAD